MIEARTSKSARVKRTLPPELILEIFLRLPTKSLKRLSCILDDYPPFSKELRTSSFRHKHAMNMMSRQGNQQMILLQSERGGDELYVIETSKRLLANPYNNQNYHFELLFKDFLPYVTEKLSDCEVIGSCNGLVCLFFKFYRSPAKVNFRGGGCLHCAQMAQRIPSYHLILWNPCTGEHHVLPTPGDRFKFKLCGGDDRPTFSGFGYDVNNETYKVVLAEDTMTKFYDLSTNVWKLASKTSIHDLYNFERECEQNMNQFGHYLNGSVHWIVSDTTIVAIDLSTEVSTLLKLPHCSCSRREPYHHHTIHNLNMGVLNGCLSVACFRSHQGNDEMVIWLMKEFGRDESWTKKFTVRLFDRLRTNDIWPPLWMSPDEETIMFLRNKRLARMNRKVKESTEIRSAGDRLLKYAAQGMASKSAVRGIVHIDTLVSPKPENYKNRKSKTVVSK